MQPFCSYCGTAFSTNFTPISDGDTLFCKETCRVESNQAHKHIHGLTFEQVQQEYESMKTYFPYTHMFKIHINRLDFLFSYIEQQKQTIQTLQKQLPKKR